MKKIKPDTPLKYYYKQLLSHKWITTDNDNSRKLLSRMRKFDALLFIICILLFAFKNSPFISFITNDSINIYYFYVIMFLYAFIGGASYTIYNHISFLYEQNHKHELLKKDITGIYQVPFYFFKSIHFPWIFLTCLVQKLLMLLRIESLKSYLPMLILGYLYFLTFFSIMLSILCATMSKLLSHYAFLTTTVVTEKTYLYIIFFISIIVSKHIPTMILNKVIQPSINKNSSDYKLIFNRYHLLNYYFLVAVTLILKALDFTDEIKLFVDALFYTTTALTLLSTAREKALK